MYRAIVTIRGIAPLSQSRQHFTPMNDGESHNEYDKRTWREKCNYDDKGIVFVPAMGLKKAFAEAGGRLSIPDPDNRKAKLTKYLVSDVIPEGNLSIGIHKDQMPSVLVMCERGSGKQKTRVPSLFPQTQEWGGTTSFLIMEEKIKPEIFERVMKAAGMSIGVGQFRAGLGGMNGRFEVTKVKIEREKN